MGLLSWVGRIFASMKHSRDGVFAQRLGLKTDARVESATEPCGSGVILISMRVLPRLICLTKRTMPMSSPYFCAGLALALALSPFPSYGP